MMVPENYIFIAFFALIFIPGIIRGQESPPNFNAPEPLRQSSALGSKFYFGFMPNAGNDFGELEFTIGTESETAVTCYYRAGSAEEQNVNVIKGSPSNIAMLNIENVVLDSSVRDAGFQISCDEEIFVLVENFFFGVAYGVYLAYPCHEVPDSTYEYYAMSGESQSDAFDSQILLVGCENDTTISIVPSQDIKLPEDLQSPTSAEVSVMARETREGLVLHERQTLLINHENDLTGTKIISNKPLTVISGHKCASVPNSFSGCEPFAVQVPPIATWGSSFLLPPFAGKTSGTVHRILTSENMTSVSIVCGNSSLGVSIQAQTYYDFTSFDYCSVQSSNRILVVQQASSGSIDSIGDPAVALVSPTDQYLNSVSFLTLPSEDFPANYISVTVPAEHFDQSYILLDGEVLDCSWITIFSDEELINIAGFGCSYQLVSPTEGSASHVQYDVSHTQDDGLLSVIVYGFNDHSGYALLSGQELYIGSDGENITLEVPDNIEYLNLTSLSGVQELEREEDASSEPISIPGGLVYGDSISATVYVNENGVISFDEPFAFYYPDRFPTANFYTRRRRVIAPFWSDNDIRRAGTVRYVTYCNRENFAEECNETHTETDQFLSNILNTTNFFVKMNAVGAEEFEGDWILIAQWEGVHPSPHGENEAGSTDTQLSKTNTYQAVLVSNVFKTYAIFTYGCGDIKWDTVRGDTKPAVVGFNSAGNFFFNHQLSGYVSVGSQLSCGSSMRRRKRQADSGSLLITLESNADIEQLVEHCIGINKRDKIDFPGGIEGLEDGLPLCPETESQAKEDDARFRPQNNTSCYVSTIVIDSEVINMHDPLNLDPTPARQCCYNSNDGSFIKIDNGVDDTPGPGTFLLNNPIRDEAKYSRELTFRNGRVFKFGDKVFRETCCDETLGNQFCEIYYYSRRPLSPTEGYTPPRLGTGNGDPHYKPFDWSTQHHFQGQGRYIISEIGSPPEFSIHGKLCELNVNPSYPVTWHVGLVFGTGTEKYELAEGSAAGTGFKLFRTTTTGVQHEDIGSEFVNNKWTNPVGDIEFSVSIRSDHYYTLNSYFFSMGIKLRINMWFYNDYNEPVYSYDIYVPADMPTLGILGNNDGNDLNDITRRHSPNDPVLYIPMMRMLSQFGNLGI